MLVVHGDFIGRVLNTVSGFLVLAALKTPISNMTGFCHPEQSQYTVGL
jgi:hypothetical protein